jgi:DNA polymerase-3 subunit gamma/tau
MDESPLQPEPAAGSVKQKADYVVVARRYRPQSFDELVGQGHVARALANAITTNRVGHAYLFTGARGVGKTSAARILAKALNCVTGPTPTPCNQCDICQSISSGDDVDVLEVDGASNRGIDEIRQLRQNVNVRPSRERFKIYIIDEVHMLTREAFNALLKTLEEPPDHVKFIFCTTEPGKIPITILSRCQRFDFAGIQTQAIGLRLRQIVDAEGVAAEPEALELLARRAAGSMRDSQSLLEQLLAFAPERIGVADVNGMLGTAGDERLTTLLDSLVRRDAAAAIRVVNEAAGEGIDPGQLLEQLFGFLRDVMMAAIGCPGETFLYCSPTAWPKIVEASKALGVDVVLAAMQIIDQALARLRYSTQARIIAELAIVRICHLEDLAEIPELIAQLQSGAIAMADIPAGSVAARPAIAPPAELSTSESSAKKNVEQYHHEEVGDTSSAAQVSRAPRIALTAANATEVWSQVVARLTGLAADHAKRYARAATSAPNRLVVLFHARYTFAKAVCERPEQKARFEQILAELTGNRIAVEFQVVPDEAAPAAPSSSAKAVLPMQRLMQISQHAMVRRAAELFGANPVRVDEPPPAGA